jgi:uncharacterized protein (TIGR02996 family)
VTSIAVAALADIIAHPQDDAPRLIYADFLEDEGEPDRAEFIRVQVELATTPPCKAEKLHRAGGLYPGHGCRCCDLRRRELELFNWRNLEAWGWHFWQRNCLDRAELNALPSDIMGVLCRRGFPSVIRCSLTDWQKYGASLVRSHPLEEVCLCDREPMEFASGRFAWFSDDVPGDNRERHGLPPTLWHHMGHGNAGSLPFDGSKCRVWKERPQALTACSAACLAQARSQP